MGGKRGGCGWACVGVVSVGGCGWVCGFLGG